MLRLHIGPTIGTIDRINSSHSSVEGTSHAGLLFSYLESRQSQQIINKTRMWNHFEVNSNWIRINIAQLFVKDALIFHPLWTYILHLGVGFCWSKGDELDRMSPLILYMTDNRKVETCSISGWALFIFRVGGPPFMALTLGLREFWCSWSSGR